MKKLYIAAIMFTFCLASVSEAQDRCLTKYQELARQRNQNKKIADTVIISAIVIEAGLAGANSNQASGGGPTDTEKKIGAATIATGVVIHLVFARKAAKVNRMVEFLSDADRFVQSGGVTYSDVKMKKSYRELWKAYKKYLKKARGEVIDLSRFAAGIHKADLNGYACGARYDSHGVGKPKQVVEVMLDYLD